MQTYHCRNVATNGLIKRTMRRVPRFLFLFAAQGRWALLILEASLYSTALAAGRRGYSTRIGRHTPAGMGQGAAVRLAK
jgi:hypothetical protein